MPKTSFDKHIEAIKAGEVTKTTVIGLRKAMNADIRRSSGWSTSSKSPKVDPATLAAAIELVEATHPIVTGELHETGLKQLQSKRYAKKLANVGDIIARIKTFRFAGFEYIGRGDQVTPLYYAEDDQHRGFFFINTPWQSGGQGPELLYR